MRQCRLFLQSKRSEKGVVRGRSERARTPLPVMGCVDVVSDRESGRGTTQDAKPGRHLSILSMITQGQRCLFLEGGANESVCYHLWRASCKPFGMLVREHLCTFALPVVVVINISCVMAFKFVSKSTFTPKDVAESPVLEPALELLLRSLKIHESVITSIRVNEILDRSVFSAQLVTMPVLRIRATEGGLRVMPNDVTGHRRGIAVYVRQHWVQLAFPAPRPGKKPRARGSRGARKGTGTGVKNNSAPTQLGGSSSGSSGQVDFDQLMKMGPKATKLVHQSNKDHAACFNIQKRQCTDRKVCNSWHVCIGCATEGKPYNECHCLQSGLN